MFVHMLWFGVYGRCKVGRGGTKCDYGWQYGWTDKRMDDVTLLNASLCACVCYKYYIYVCVWTYKCMYVHAYILMYMCVYMYAADNSH